MNKEVGPYKKGTHRRTEWGSEEKSLSGKD